jgi:calreticulin
LGFAAVNAEVLFKETFGAGWEKRWITSSHKDDYGKVDVTAGEYYNDKEADAGLHTSEDAKNYAVSALFDKSFSNEGKTLAIQFSVAHPQGIDCGGGYLKFLPKFEQKEFHGGEGESQYNIMFGPDVCGHTKKVHLIFNYKGKNLLWKKEPRIETDKFTHLYTLILNSDNTYEVRVDNEKKESGKLEDDWDFLEPKEIPDPEDKKPEGWDDIPENIVDPEAEKPEDWDDEDDGEWEPPLIDNPEFKGEWVAPKIANPAYKGEWSPKQIKNDKYEEGVQLAAYDSSYIGFELWIVNNGTIFDNILVTDDIEYAKAQGEKLWRPTSKDEKEKKEAWDKENKPAEPDMPEGGDEEGEGDEEEKDEL